MNVTIKRAYDASSADDGTRVLVDRFWPRGVKREDARLDGWFKDIAPSADLIRSFAHRPERWEEFKRLYRAELDANTSSELEKLREMARGRKLTLVYAARDREHNNARALADYLTGS